MSSYEGPEREEFSQAVGTADERRGFLAKGRERDEKGFVTTRLAKKGLVIVPALGLATIAFFNTANSGMEISADASLEDAQVNASVTKMVWDPDKAIDPATLHFSENLDARGIDTDITARAEAFGVKGPDLIRGPLEPQFNKQLTGSGAEDFDIPFSAIGQEFNEEGNKIDLTVDFSKIEGNIYWTGAGPELQDYTVDDGEKNFGDRSGLRDSIMGALGAAGRVINVDTLGNTIEDLNNDIEHDMRLKGLEVFGQCNKESELVDKLKSLADEAIRANAALYGRAEDIGEIKFVNDVAGFDTDTGQETAGKVGDTYSHEYQLEEGNFNVDSLDCSPSE